MRRHLLLMPIIATVAGTVGIGGVTIAGPPNDRGLRASSTQSGLEIDDVDLGTAACTHEDPATSRCAIPFHETDTLTGDLVGQEQNADGLSVSGAGLHRPSDV